MGYYIQFADEGLEQAIASHSNPNGFDTIEQAHAEANACEASKVDYARIRNILRSEKMIRNGLYHYVTGLPKVELPNYIALFYGRHAKDQMMSDRYGVIAPPFSLDVTRAKIIEMEICQGYVSKL